MLHILFILTLLVMALLGYRLMVRLDNFLSSGDLHPYWDATEETHHHKKRAAQGWNRRELYKQGVTKASIPLKTVDFFKKIAYNIKEQKNLFNSSALQL